MIWIVRILELMFFTGIAGCAVTIRAELVLNL
jgi:hypothetical protein